VPRGGKRPGAGRPSDGTRVAVTLRLPVPLVEKLRAQAEALGVSQADLVASLIERLS
jgi:hypothetical protein